MLRDRDRWDLDDAGYHVRRALDTEERCLPPMYVDVWAYDTEHAMEKVDSPEEGWAATGAERVRL